MSRSTVEMRFFRAAQDRGENLKSLARLAGTSYIRMKRLNAGTSRNLTAALVEKVALRMRDPERFLAEVYAGVVREDPGARAVDRLGEKIDALGARIDAQAVRPAGVPSCWVLDDGSVHAVKDGDFAAAARMLAGLGAGGDAVDYVCRGFGWIAIAPASGEDPAAVRLDRGNVDITACRTVAGLLARAPDAVQFLVHDGIDSARSESRAGVVRLLERRIAAQRRTPFGWIDEEIPLDEASGDLREIIDSGACGHVAAHADRILATDRASLFAITQDEALCLHIGRGYRVPTERDVGMRVLDRMRHPHYASLVDRHIVRASKLGRPTLTRVGADFGGRRILYERLALPYALGSLPAVLTTSRVISDTEQRPLASA